ncbi:efflux RND transporter periplasmic adaptor subunit [Deinococcus sp. QL22]|uniref:efflux RND transporter periplasmic adaptor subunit n=1 Tax=Deinococcus sp. QL22 TaxID=2939437 RepID=UPI002016F024|nr:efflux RND transporter periplasmic adaptor subunit [Deinococcus sp. QL22]UQN09722.1 efflux RND transporter periplasmic adaptor subunit [Deinococcus sp. QL22]
MTEPVPNPSPPRPTPPQSTQSRTPTRSAPRKRWPWVLGALLLIGGVTGGVIVTRNRAAQAQTATPTTQTQAVQRGVVRVSVSGPGTLEASATRTVGVSRSVTVGALPAVGERVTRGQLLTTLTSDDVQDSVKTAELNLLKARASLDATRASQASGAASRQSSVTSAESSVAQVQQTLSEARTTLNAQEQLAAIGAVSRQALDEARNAVTNAELDLKSARSSAAASRTQLSTNASSDAENLRSAQIAVQQAQASLDTAQQARTGLKVYAPITGVVSAVSATEGAVLASAAGLLTLMDDSTLELPVQVDETEIAGVKVGQPASVTLDAVDGETFSGQVVRVSPAATQSSGISVFTATVRLPNSGGVLRAGMTAEAEIVQSEDRGLIVPQKAIETVRSRSYVQVQGTEGTEPERVRVELGDTDGTNTVIRSGLTSGQEVVVPGTTPSPSGTTSGSTTRTPGVGRPPAGFGGAP